MKNILLVLLVSLFSFGGNAQELIKEYAGLLLELEQNVSNKEFVKSWKKQRKVWESSCEAATTVKQASDLSVEFLSRVYQVKMLKIMVVSSEDLHDQCNGLANAFNVLKGSDLDGWNGKDAWSKKLTELTVKAKTQKEKAAAKKRALFIKNTMEDFESVFKEVLEDSKKGSFANVISGPKKDDGFGVKVKFKAGENQKIVVDSDNIYEFQAEFNTNDDALLAAALQAAMLKIITANVPDGFAKSVKYDKAFVKNEGYFFEFKAERFALTAKQPSVLIGAKKNGSSVVLKISEPVFKR